MSAINSLNADADVVQKNQALMMNITAANALSNIIKTNLGPKGTLKTLVSGGGDLTLTKDGNVLLKQMQIQHPTAALIARTATAQDDITGDGTTSTVLFTAALLKQAERYVVEGLHPRVLVEGMELARDFTIDLLKKFKTDVTDSSDRTLLLRVARCSLRTKLEEDVADHLAEIVVDAVLCIKKEGEEIDLHMVEIQEMKHRSQRETRLVKGLVLDHGARHPNMSRYNKDCFVLTCNVSLEYENSEVNSGFFYSNAAEREQLVSAERAFTDKKVQKIIDFKNYVVGDTEKSFVLVNQKGIDPVSLDMLQRAGIVGIRRAKRRNMERLPLACGGYCVNSVDDLTEDCLGYAEEVYEHTLGEDKFTFVEGVRNPLSCTILIRAPHKHSISRIKDAIRDGLRSVKNVLDDKSVVAGAGAFEVHAHLALQSQFKHTVEGRAKLGVAAFADALLVIPKVLATNSGLDQQDAMLALLVSLVFCMLN